MAAVFRVRVLDPRLVLLVTRSLEFCADKARGVDWSQSRHRSPPIHYEGGANTI